MGANPEINETPTGSPRGPIGRRSPDRIKYSGVVEIDNEFSKKTAKAMIWFGLKKGILLGQSRPDETDSETP